MVTEVENGYYLRAADLVKREHFLCTFNRAYEIKKYVLQKQIIVPFT